MTPTEHNADDHARPAVLPTNATWRSVSGIEGWLYTIFDPYGDQYIFFLWYDGLRLGYSVSLVDPPLEEDPHAEDMRLLPDGRLAPFASGQPMTFLTAFHMSIAWAAFRSTSQRMDSAAGG